MGREVNLLARLPQGKRNITARATAKTPQIIAKSREYGFEYFDGPRELGYGGYRYDGRWVPIAEDIVKHFGLKAGDRVLDVGVDVAVGCGEEVGVGVGVQVGYGV